MTGAAAGMGLATAQAFAEAGATGVLADISEGAVSAEAKKLAAAVQPGGELTGIRKGL